MKPQNLIVFDMDGVLVDVSASYRDVVRKTARLFFKGARSWERLPDHLFSLADLADIKQSGGLNNDWDLTAATLDLKWSQYITERSSIRLRLRGYRQTGAEFAGKNYDGDEAYHTADIRFHPFSSLLIGGKFASVFPDNWLTSWYLPDRWDVSYDYLMRNTRGDDRLENTGRLYQLYGPEEHYLQGTVMFGVGFDF